MFLLLTGIIGAFTGEEEKLNYNVFNEIYGNLCLADTSNGKCLLNEKEIICNLCN